MSGANRKLRLDRIQLVVPDRSDAAAAWQRLLDAPLLREDRVRSLGCRRSVIGVGTSEVELLEPDGAGPVADAGPGLFAAGLVWRFFRWRRIKQAHADAIFDDDGPDDDSDNQDA